MRPPIPISRVSTNVSQRRRRASGPPPRLAFSAVPEAEAPLPADPHASPSGDMIFGKDRANFDPSQREAILRDGMNSSVALAAMVRMGETRQD